MLDAVLVVMSVLISPAFVPQYMSAVVVGC